MIDTFSNTEKQVILGSLLGDGNLSNNRKNAYFRISHSIKQYDYCYHKYLYLKKYCYHPPKISTNFLKQTGKYYGYCSFASFRDVKFTELWNNWYNSHKIIYENDLWSIEPLGLAIWFMDDGSCGEFGRRRQLATMCFSLEEHYLIKDVLKQKFGLTPNITKATSGTGYCLDFTGDNNRLLVHLIKPFIIDSMLYKIDRVSKQQINYSDDVIFQNTVVKLLEEGWLKKEIAQKLNVSVNTISRTCKKIFHKSI